MKLFKVKQELSSINKKLSNYTKEWINARKGIEKDVKKNKLTIDNIYKYMKSCIEFKTFVQNNTKSLVKENKNLTEKNCINLVKDIDINIKWCEKIIEIDKEMRDKVKWYK